MMDIATEIIPTWLACVVKTPDFHVQLEQFYVRPPS